MCSKPGVGSRDLRGVLGARLNNPAVVIHHSFDDADRHVSVDRVGGLVGILGVLHELLDPLRGEADFDFHPRTHAIPWRAVVRAARLNGEPQPVCARDRPNLPEAAGEKRVSPKLFLHVRGVEQVGVQVKRYA